jgi:hypothetical protein
MPIQPRPIAETASPVLPRETVRMYSCPPMGSP